ncbi:MAG: hypothetical protein M0R05_07680, partial [Bacilli bacterium]|nr:hypothetical protein [Bacilli bacterium]
MNRKGDDNMKNNETTTLKRHRRTTFNQRLGRIFIYLFLSLIALMIILPFVQLVLASFKSAREINLDTFFPKEWKFSNYKAVFKETV